MNCVTCSKEIPSGIYPFDQCGRCIDNDVKPPFTAHHKKTNIMQLTVQELIRGNLLRELVSRKIDIDNPAFGKWRLTIERVSDVKPYNLKYKEVEATRAILSVKKLPDVIITNDFLISNGTEGHGFNGKQVAIFGLKYPLKSGWKKTIIGTVISGEDALLFARLKGATKKNKPNLPTSI